MADEKRPVGRPTKLNAKVAERIVKLVIGGNYLETAAASCGVSAQVVRD